MKLRKLIVSGFKSFADRTEFDFDDGISCVVGPNGCGKSNVVDAVKWVLGEQSAKSLRGSEMMDVIFNGSSSRRPGSSAEVSLVFDNSDGRLNPGGNGDQPPTTVSVTRKLFRNGQSDYLINKSPSRLRDIREMFMDTGVGVDAYSVIEQGRVEGFLQSSQEDRRSIFDEAAGISKYKARRKEALRKIERVDQNLLRLTDIVGEVEKRLRSIKYQAGKARSYQTYTEQLKELRLLNFLAQYHSLSVQRGQLRIKLDAGVDGLSAITARIEQLETTRSGADVELSDLERSAGDLQGKIAAAGGLIAAGKQRGEMLESRVKELTEQVNIATRACQELSGKIEACGSEIAARAGEIEKIQAQLATRSGEYEAKRTEHTGGELAINKLSAELEDQKAGAIDLMRRSSQLHNEIHSLGIRRENLTSQKTRQAARAEEIAAGLAKVQQDKAALSDKLEKVRSALVDYQARHDQARKERAKLADSEQTFQNKLSSAREQRSGVLSRTGAINEMQQRLEGVGVGVQRILKARGKGKLDFILGMLGDFLETDVDHAPLVEAALAGADQTLLADRFQNVQAGNAELAAALGDNGSVEIQPLDNLERLSGDFDISSLQASGDQVVGRLIDHVRCEPAVSPLLWRLLGRTLVVKDLSAAAGAAELVPQGYRFVTLAGEVVEAGGRIRLGSSRRAAGVITRRSELAVLAGQQKQLDEEIAELDRQCKTAKAQRQSMEELDQTLRQSIYEANTQRVESESRLNQAQEQLARLQREEPVIARDIQRITQEIAASLAAEAEAGLKAAEIEQQSKDHQQKIEQLTAQIAAMRTGQAQLTAQLTELKVALAQLQQQKLSAGEAQAALVRHREAMEKDHATAKSQIELNAQRQVDCQNGITAARAEVAKHSAVQESLKAEAIEIEESRQGLQEKLDQIRSMLSEIRAGQDKAAAAVNACRVELGESDVRIETLISRASEEMGMNLLEGYQGYQHDDNRNWAEVEAQIADLKGKIERLGNVNLDSIAEQDELEKRGQFLTEQLADVKSSQNQLNELIKRINKESRDMFIRSFEVIRANFQELFRKLFGGGKADVILLNPEDVLESPIEIVARPPGKELRSISLLSGGEKTMTALALLFSIFRSRPSPFCLLDEVDAALDEANNRRFNTLLGEFINDSQFIVISHSKRTMSMASVLYGVTMQEPGVSKRISVKFEEAAQHAQSDLQPA
jgi:chromosome segregation protein